MQAICPDCLTTHELNVPLKDYTVTCNKCRTIFLAPTEALPTAIQSHDDLETSIKKLEDAYTQERYQLEDRLQKQFKTTKRQLEQDYEKSEKELRKTRDTEADTTVKHPVANKLLKIVLTIYFLAVIIVNGILVVNQYYSTKDLILLDLKSSEKIFGNGLAEAIWNMDDTGLQAIISGMLEHPVIVGVRIVDDESTEIAVKGIVGEKDGMEIPADTGKYSTDSIQKKISAGRLFSYAFPILYTSEEGGKTVTGKATVYSETGLIFQRLKMGYWLLGINGVTVAIILTISFLWVSRLALGRPLSMLTNAVSTLNLENLDTLEVHVDTRDRNELKILEESFNRMVHSLIEEKKTILQMSSTFEKFIPKQFLSRIAEKGIGTIKLGSMDSERLSILYAQIQSFDDISDRLDADKQYRFLNAYLAAMEVPIEKHGGFIFQLSKTAIMALFTLNDHSIEALSAVYAAIDMQKAIRAFNEDQQSDDSPSISIGIGIHSGDVILGTLGNETRLESTVIGESIESAIRLSDLTGHYDSQILISHNTFSLLESFDAFQWRELDAIHLRHEADTVRIFEVFDADPAFEIKQQILDTFHQGLDDFHKRKWESAEKHFEKCLKTYPVDVVSQIYIKRCKGYKADNSGIVDFLQKESEVFRSLDDISIAELAQSFGTRQFDKADPVVRYGEVGEIFYVVRNGSLEVVVPGEDGSEVVVATLSKGDCFGEMSLMTGDPTMATIKGVMPGDLLTLNHSQFEAMLRNFSTLNSYFHRLFLDRLLEDKAKILDDSKQIS